MTNQEVAQHLNEIAFFYKQNNKAFQAKAFESVALQVSSLSHPLEFSEASKLATKLQKCGPATTKVIEQFHSTKTSDKFNKFLADGAAPASVAELTRIPGVGVKTAIKIYNSFKIHTLEELNNKIELLKHTEYEKYIEPFLQIKDRSDRIPRGLIKAAIDQILEPLEIDWSYAGSMRRHREELRDVDVIVVENDKLNKNELREYFLNTYGLEADVRNGDSKWGLSVPVADRLVVLDLNFCKPEEFGGYVNYLTGGVDFNIECRRLCKAKGWLLNQKGVFDSDGNQIDDSTEEGLYRLLEIPYVPPECRTGADAVGKDFSNLVTDESLIIDLHSHSVDSDGGAEWIHMSMSAEKQGVKVLGISDHSQGSGSGVKKDHKPELVELFNEQRDRFPIRTLYSAEVDIKVNGTCDYSDRTIRSLDYAIFALHHSYDKNVEERIISTFERLKDIPKIWAHPEGRKIDLYSPRLAASVDWDKIFKVCKETNTLLEINSWPDRQDCSPELIRKGLEAGVYFAINSDCHGVNFRRLLNVGATVGRRGWLMKDRCVSTSEELLDRWLAGKLYL